MNFDDLLKKRRSVRHFLVTPVPRNIINDLIFSASLSPVSCNLQLTQYVVVDDVKILDSLSKVSYKFRYSPCSILVLHDSRFSIERTSGIMTAGMAVENLLLKIEEIGLGGCAMAGFGGDDKIKKILGIPEHMDILLAISVGYPDKDFIPNDMPRISTQDRYSFNNYGSLGSINGSVLLDDHNTKDLIDYRKRISAVYLDRFRLNTYNEKYYEEVLKDFKDKYFVGGGSYRVLDLMSYDGIFLSLLHKDVIFNKSKITSSDYLLNNIDFFKKKFNYEYLQIDSNNNIKTSDKFDFITYIFQLNFTPDVEGLIKSSSRLLNEKGVILVSVMHESWYRRLAKYLDKIIKKLVYRKIFNIYENNAFYKIGPMKNYSSSDVIKIYENNELKFVSKKLIKKSRGLYLGVYYFSKN